MQARAKRERDSAKHKEMARERDSAKHKEMARERDSAKHKENRAQPSGDGQTLCASVSLW